MRSAFRIRGWLAAALLGALALTGRAQQTAPGSAPAAADTPTTAALVAEQQQLIAAEPAPTIDRTLTKMRMACEWQLNNLYFYPLKKSAAKPAAAAAGQPAAQPKKKADQPGAKGKGNGKGKGKGKGKKAAPAAAAATQAADAGPTAAAAASARNSDMDWVRGAFYTGVMGAYQATTDYRFLNAAKEISERNKWQTRERARKPRDRQAHADDHTIAQTYLELYLLGGKKDPSRIEAIKAVYDALAANPQEGRYEWWWCDALYMDPPTMAMLAAATGDNKYLELMDKLYWDSYEYLYDKDEHLIYRDDSYFNKRERNGRKVFWSRGDGWVFGGLCRVLDYMPKDYPSRPKYEALFKEMAAAIVKTQGPEGLWHASLLDPSSYPLGETSGSGFFTYGLAWGINNGLLDRAAYLPAVQKGWKALMACVDNETGKLQYVQFIGANPQLIKRSDNLEYGTGSFLLAGGQVLKLMAGQSGAGVEISAANPLELARASETVEIPWATLAGKVQGLLPARVRVADAAGKDVVSQVVYDQNGPASLIFQADFAPKESKSFKVTLSDEPLQTAPEAKAYGRFVPERLDDFAWENDRIAFRVYGPGLQTRERAGKEYMISSGIDVWVKKVRYPIVNKWYADDIGKVQSYHEDHGEGCDNYKVDNSRGVGGFGIWEGGKLTCSENFTGWKVLAAGPIRVSFELSFAPWEAGGHKFSEVKRVTLDAGSSLNHLVSQIQTDETGPYQIGAGLTQTNGEGQVVKSREKGILSYWENPDPKGKGSIATGVVFKPAQFADFSFMNVPKAVQNMVILTQDPKAPIDYYAGAGWSKSGDFADAAAWQKYLEEAAQKIAAPLQVSVK